MATSDNITTAPAASITLKATSAESGLTGTDFVIITVLCSLIGILIGVISVIIACLRFCYGDDCIGKKKEQKEQQRRGKDTAEQRPRRGKDTAEQRPLVSGQPADRSQPTAVPQQPGCSTKQSMQDAANKCEKTLKHRYIFPGSYVQMDPFGSADKRHFEKIYTKLNFENCDGKDGLGPVNKYSDIFKFKTREGNPVRRAILQGSAGLGKTTLINKIAYDWACGTVRALKKYKLVFVLNMNSLNQTTDVIDELFKQLLEGENINREDLTSFIKTWPKKVLFLLDGFNEIMPTELDKTQFGTLLKMLNIRKGEYKKCSVLVSTRSSHYNKLTMEYLIERPFALVNVLGFSEDGIGIYVHKFYSKSKSNGDAFLDRIKSSEVLIDLAKRPMLLLSMCLLWSRSATLPDTMFQLFDEVLPYIFKLKMDKSKEDILSLVVKIGKVAFHGLLSSVKKTSFQEEDFKEGGLDMAIQAGILSIQRVCNVFDTCTNVEFIHKTRFQEFCAAVYYQSEKSESETQKFQTFFDELPHQNLEGFEYLLRFCCGRKEESCTNSMLNIISQKVEHAGDLNDNNLQIFLNCYFESKVQTLPPSELIDFVFAQRLKVVSKSRDHMRPLVHFLNRISDKTKGEGNAYFKNIHSLSITNDSGANLPQDDWASLLSSLHLKEMKALQTVALSGCAWSRSDIEHIAQALSNLPNLVELDLSGNKTLKSARQWSNLAKIKTLNKLDLSRCNLRVCDLERIAEALRNMPVLTTLILSGNDSIGDSERITKTLKLIPNLVVEH